MTILKQKNRFGFNLGAPIVLGKGERVISIHQGEGMRGNYYDVVEVLNNSGIAIGVVGYGESNLPLEQSRKLFGEDINKAKVKIERNNFVHWRIIYASLNDAKSK